MVDWLAHVFGGVACLMWRDRGGSTLSLLKLFNRICNIMIPRYYIHKFQQHAEFNRNGVVRTLVLVSSYHI